MSLRPQTPFETPPKRVLRHKHSIEAQLLRFEDGLRLAATVDEIGINNMLLEFFHSSDMRAIFDARGVCRDELTPMAAGLADAEQCVKMPRATDEVGYGSVEPVAESSRLDSIDTTGFDAKALGELAMWRAAESTNFRFPARAAAGNPLASRFERRKAANPQMKKDYDALKGNQDAQMQFRQDWAKETFENYVVVKKKITTLVKSQWRKGQYMPLGRIVHKEGGGKLGWMQAQWVESVHL
jgi:hypothetical protein